MPPFENKDNIIEKGNSFENSINGCDKDRSKLVIKGQALKQTKRTLLGPNVKEMQKTAATGRWTDEEHNLFLEGLKKFPYRAWKQIATMIETRTVVQIRTHAQKYYQKLSREAARPLESEPVEDSDENESVSQKATSARKRGASHKRKRKTEGHCTRGKKHNKKRVRVVFREQVKAHEVELSTIKKEKKKCDADCTSEQADKEDGSEIEQFPILDSLPLVDDNSIELTRSVASVDDMIFLQMYPSEGYVSDLSDDGSFAWLQGTDDEQDQDSLSSMFSSQDSPFSDLSTDPVSPSSSYGEIEAFGDGWEPGFTSERDPLLDPEFFVFDFFKRSHKSRDNHTL